MTDLEDPHPVNNKASDASKNRTALRKLFDDTRKRLVETGTRNRLVHVNRANIRGNVVNIINERSDDVYGVLSAKKMRFLAIGKDKNSGDEEGAGNALQWSHAEDEDFDDARYSDNQLEVKLGPDALQKRLLKIARESRTAEEEQGINILYLALGFMTWFEDKSSAMPREAPLILLPVELVRNDRTSTFDVQMRGDDIVTNLPLAQRLKDDFGITLPELEIVEDWRPSHYFNLVAETISERKRWTIDRDGIQMGFFSFAKLLMYLDLDPDRWPDGSLEKHGLVKGLLHRGFEGEEPAIGDQDRLDDILSPAEIFHVVDADSSQTKVIEEVRRGRNLVVQGPPGTGKSQTITNIIATAAREGKTVLFVAEKMAALSVVHDRLVKTGLADICLELHSKASNKKAVLAELGRTLSASGAIPNMPPSPDNLCAARDRLNGITGALHQQIGHTGETPFAMLARQARYLGMGVKPPMLDSSEIGKMSQEEEDELVGHIQQFGDLIAALGAVETHAFVGIRNLELQPVDLERFNQKLETAQQSLAAFQSIYQRLAQLLALDIPCSFSAVSLLANLLSRLKDMPDEPHDLIATIFQAADKSRLLETLVEGEEWRARHEALQPYFVEAAFSSPAMHMRGPLVAGESSFFARFGSAYRGSSKELAGLLQGKLPKKATERLTLLDDLLDVQARHNRWTEDESYCANILGDEWRGARTNFARLAAITRWAIGVNEADIDVSANAAIAAAADSNNLIQSQEQLTETARIAKADSEGALSIVNLDLLVFGEGALDAASSDQLAARINGMRAAIPDYKKWAQYCGLAKIFEVLNLSDLATQMKSQALSRDDAVIELRFARAEHLWNRALEDNSALSELRNFERHKLVSDYRAMEKDQFKANVTAILAQHLSQMPKGAQGEMGVVRGELGKKRAHIALRKLFTKAPNALSRIKPILLMSPISVAQFLEPGLHEFDLLVIDEASQVRPEDALGAIARAKQIVVVGDQKQLPPTSFFDRLLGDTEEDGEENEDNEDLLAGAAKLSELESVLSLCEARGLGSRMLEWHYRSRDPSLIKVSNREFYEDGLILPPSPLQGDPDYGLCFTKVDGAYDRGGKRDNRKEGEAIVAKIREHARQTPKLSLGVVTFSSAQRNLLTELLELARRQDDMLDEFLREGKSEDFFVKNIENVQGDQRDIILVSVGYGPVIAGGALTSMSFGPINADGGERRLNVLFTRAKLRCEIFASFDPSAMDTSRVSREGPKILKRFLEFAQSGVMVDAEITGEDADSPFEEDVADEIKKLGFLADNQVGSAGFKIDLGVRDPGHPGRYILAVECDGATYHSALWARERDRLRQDVLEHLGWRFHRIWSTDWFYNRSAEIKRLSEALQKAKTASEKGIEVSGSNTHSPRLSLPASASKIEIPEIIERQMPPYVKAALSAAKNREPHEVHIDVLATLAEQIVGIEGPIHQEEVARRIAEAFGKERAGARINALALKALRKARQSSSAIKDSDAFWYTKEQHYQPPVRSRAAEQGPTVKAGNISLLEIRAALAIAREDNAGGSDDELVRSAAQLLGFKRVGPELRLRLQEGL